MKTVLMAAALAATIGAPLAVAPAQAQQGYGGYGNRDDHQRDGRDANGYGNNGYGNNGYGNNGYGNNGYGYGNNGQHRDHDGGWRGGDRNWNPQDSYRDGYRGQERRLGRNDQIYRGRDNRYYCKRNDGTTGLVIGALGGGVAGNVLGGGTLGTLLGAGGGALLGRSIDRGNGRGR